MTDALTAVDERAAAVAKEPTRRISKKFIEDYIIGVHYITGDQFVNAAKGQEPQYADIQDRCKHLTVCMIECENGFMVVGESAPMEPANFNAELGRQLAYEDAFRKLWPLYAFAYMQDELLYGKDEGPEDPAARMAANHDGETSPPSTSAKEE